MSQNSSVGRTWAEVRQEMFTKEEIAESDLRVALIGEIVKARKEKGRFLFGLIFFAGLLLVMLVLLITVGKSAIIENIPMVAAYILLFMLNFTSFFDKKPEKV